MAGSGGDQGAELFLQGFLSDGSATRKYLLVPPWEPCPPPQPVASDSSEDDDSASLPAPAPPNPGVADGGEVDYLEVRTVLLSMKRGGLRLASFELVPVAADVDVHTMGGDSHIKLHVDPLEGQAIVRFYKNDGSSSRWLSTWVYSMNAVSDEATEIADDFGETELSFNGPVLEDLSCPPMKINFLRNFICDDRIGNGSEGIVYKCHAPFMGGKMSAVKEVSKALEFFRTPAHNCEPSEVHIMSILNHGGIVRLYQAWTETNTNFIGMKLCQRSLKQYLDNVSEVSLENRLCIFMQLIIVVEFMHRKGVVHRDIKPANVLLDGPTVKLADFGLAKIKRTQSSTFPGGGYGSLPYRAPEITNIDARHDEKVDIFPLGMVYFGICLPREKRKKKKVKQLSDIIRRGIEECGQEGRIFDLSDYLLTDETDTFDDWEGDYRILKPMLRTVPSERPSAAQILDVLYLEKEGMYLLKDKTNGAD